MGDEAEPTPQVVNRWLGIVGLVVAPTTLITSLLYYFGYVATRKNLLYFGVDPDAVGYTTSDYVTNSVGIVFALALGLLAVSAALLLAGLYIRRLARAGRGTRLMSWAAWVLIGLGAVATVVGLVGVWGGLFGVGLAGLTEERKRAVTPVALGGAALLLLGFWLLRTSRSSGSLRRLAGVERALVAIAVAVAVAALFWATNIFATKAGEMDGINAAGSLWWRENAVVLDTTERLNVDEAPIKETPPNIADPAAVKTFRYECFRALVVRGDRWLLVPAKWTPNGGIAMIVTANSSNHITVKRINDPRKTTGEAPNVWKYWPCPELVRTAKGPEVAGLLLGVEEVRAILGGRDLVAEGPYTQGPAGADTPTAHQSCAAAADSLTQLPDRGSGFVMRRGRTMTDAEGATQKRWVEEAALEFENPAQAAQFVDEVGRRWRNCAHTTLKLDYPDHEQQWTFGDVGYSSDDGLVVVSSTVVGDPPRQCSHALAAKSNVVVDVQMCGSQPPTQATAVLDAIRNKFPLWVEERR
jgi:hypothetical protein